MKKIISLIILLATSLPLWAQHNAIEMADTLRNNGKIYVVVFCIAIILIGLFIYLFRLDSRLKKLEKKSK